MTNSNMTRMFPVILIGQERFLNRLKFCINIEAVSSTSQGISNKQKKMFPVLLFTLVTVQNVCKKGIFLLKETILSSVKENKQKNFMVYLWRKKNHPCSIDGTANMAEPYCVHLDIFFMLQVF